MHTEKHTAWLSRDDVRGEYSLVFEWGERPPFIPLAPGSSVWGWCGGGDSKELSIRGCRARYGFVPAPGTCVPVYVTTTFSPGAVVHAPKEASDE